MGARAPGGLKEILLDRREGAAQLLLRVVIWLREHSESLEEQNRAGTLALLRETRPAMAAFAALADRLEKFEDPVRFGELQQIQAEIAAADEQIAARFCDRILNSAPVRVVTLSWSSTVLTALFAARNRLEMTYVLESHPGGEGRRLFEKSSAFVKTELCPDVDLIRAVDRSDLGIIGADTLFADGAVLNKVLSKSLAQALAGQKKRFYVLASRWKTSRLASREYRPEPADAGLFEIVPAALISGIITE